MFGRASSGWNMADLLVDAANLGTPTADEVRQYWRSRGVFVSSVMSEFPDERAAATDAIRSRGARAVAWETITPRPVKAEEAWLDGVNASDALVLLLGRRYGVVRDDGFSATEAEFRRAEERGITRWAFVDGRVRRDERDLVRQGRLVMPSATPDQQAGWDTGPLRGRSVRPAP